MAVEKTPAAPYENNALRNILQSQLGSHDGKFLCAFSGGLDSSVLLHAAAGIPAIRLRAIHVHHGLHADADQWAGHCKKICQALDIPLVIVNVDVKNNDGKGIEAAARNARYQAIAQHIHEDEILLTAHHLQDQAETVLLRFLRGSGSRGLGAMRIESAAHGFRQRRPFLSVSRMDMQNYAARESLEWIEDPSNLKTDFDRNYLRHEILPLLEKRWPHAIENLSRSAGLLAEEHQCLREQSQVFLSQIQGIDPQSLSVSALSKYSRAWRAHILRTWVESLDAPSLPANILREIEQSLLHTRPDASALVKWSDFQIARWRDNLYLSKATPEMPDDWQVRWDGVNPFAAPDGTRWGFEPGNEMVRFPIHIRDTFGDDLLVALRTGGEKILLENHGHHSTVKNCLQELGVPPRERKTAPVLSTPEGECLAIGDILVSARFKAFCNAHGTRFTRIV